MQNLGNITPYSVAPVTYTQRPGTEFYAIESSMRCMNAVRDAIKAPIGTDVTSSNILLFISDNDLTIIIRIELIKKKTNEDIKR